MLGQIAGKGLKSRLPNQRHGVSYAVNESHVRMRLSNASGKTRGMW